MPAFQFDDPNTQLSLPGETGQFQDTWDAPTQPSAPTNTPESKIGGFPGFLLNLSQGATNVARGLGLGGISDLLAMSPAMQSVQKLTGINPAMSSQDIPKRMTKTPWGETVVNPITGAEDVAGAASWMLPATLLGRGVPGLVSSGGLRGLLAGLSQPNQTPGSLALSAGIGGVAGGLSSLFHPIQTAQDYVSRAVENSPATIDMNAPLSELKGQLPEMATSSPFTSDQYTQSYNDFSNWLSDKIAGRQPQVPIENAPFIGGNPEVALNQAEEEASQPAPQHALGQVLFEGAQPGEYVRAGTPGAVRLGNTTKYVLGTTEGIPTEIPPANIEAPYIQPAPVRLGPQAPITMGENTASKVLPAVDAQAIKRLIPYMQDVSGGNQIVANAFGNPHASPGISIPASYYSALSKQIGEQVPEVNLPNSLAAGLHQVPNAVNATARILPFNIGKLLEMLGGVPLGAVQSLFPSQGNNMSALLPYLFNAANNSGQLNK